MKMTLLELTQDILSDMDSDEVNSINDTLEAQQIMRIIRTTYDEIIGSRKWPHLSKLIQLIGLGDLERPTHMQIPENVPYIEWLKYNQKDGLLGLNDITGLKESGDERVLPVSYRTPEQFIDILNARKSSSTDVKLVYDDNVDVGPLLIQTNAHPTYWTTFDDEYIVFDSIDSSIVGQTTATSERTIAQAYVETEFVFEDTFVPDLPAKAFSYLLSESKSVAFNSIGQAPNQKEEQRSRRQRTFLARDKRRSNKGVRYPNYGRSTARRSQSNNLQTDNLGVNDPDYLP